MGITFHPSRAPVSVFRHSELQNAGPAKLGRGNTCETRVFASRIVSAASLLALLSACSMFSSSTPIAPSSRSSEGATMDKTQAQQFTDIPIPAGARMDLDRTLILGPRDTWIGRLVYTSGAAPNDLFEFYNRELPRFGWTGITAVRAGTSVLSFSRGERIATVQINRTTLGSSEVSVTISPRGSMDGGGYAPSPAAPVNRAPVQPQPLR